MFSKKVTDDDDFMSLSASAQALYLHLMMSADDDGFTKQVSISMFKAHASVQDLEALLQKRYVYQFENGVIVIKHWRMSNALRKDRYTPTIFQDEMSQLQLTDGGVYEVGCQVVAERLPSGCRPSATGKVRKGKESIGEDRIDYNAVADLYNRICVSLPKCQSLSDKRRKHIRARLKEYSMEQLEVAFSKAEASDFLTGKKNGFRASFDWMMKSTDNLKKVLEGNYDNNDKSTKPSNSKSFLDYME